MKRVLMLCAIMFFTSVACEKPVIDDPVDDSSCVPFELTKSQSEFVECNNGNAFNLLKGLMDDAQCKNDDFVVSPLSAYILMGALANGADGQTRDQILDALGFNGGSISQINECCQYFMNGSDAVDAKTKIGIYNAVIVNRDYPLKPVFS